MPRRVYLNKKLNDEKLYVIQEANRLLEGFVNQGFIVTLRQMYYQFVAQNLFGPERWYVNVSGNKWQRADPSTPGATINAEPNYDWLGDILADGRMCGYIDWDYMEDRTRNLSDLPHWADPAAIVDAISRQFRIPKWSDQPNYVEVWIEKDALVGVIEPICHELDVPFFSCRGYTSLSEMWSASQRLLDRLDKGKRLTILHLGDHDPSGIDMTRDIEERLFKFLAIDHFRNKMEGSGLDIHASVDWVGERFTVDRIALNMDQVELYDPPPNWAKLSDSRARGYIAEYGRQSWELDALEPRVLADLIEEHVLDKRDDELWRAAVRREAEHTRTLEAASERWDDVAKFLADT